MAGSIEAYIRQAAAARGINPDVAVRVARSEGGLVNPTQQSYVVKNGRRETSYGPFQLRIGGGLGDGALKAGIDPRKDADWKAGVDYALNFAAKNGWGNWYGAAKVGVSNFAGINKASRALALNSDTGVSAAQQAAAAMASGQAGGVLRQGSRGPAVSQLQQQLASAGLYKGKVDGSYGPQTAAAVRAAESTYGLTRDKGIAGPQVQAALAGTGATQDITSTFGLAPPGGPADMPGFDPVTNGLGRAPGGYAPPTDPSFMHGPPSYGQGITPMPQPYGSVPPIAGGDALHAPISMLGAPPVMPGQFMGGEPSQGPAAPFNVSSRLVPTQSIGPDTSYPPDDVLAATRPAPPVGPRIAAAPQSAPGGPPLALPASLPYRGSPPYSGFGPTLGAPSAEEAAAMARNRDREVTAVRHVPDFTSEYATPFHQPARPITPTPDWMQRQDDANAQFGNELANGIGNFFGGSATAASKPNLYDVAPSPVPDSNRFTPTDITPFSPPGLQSSIGGFPQIASADPNYFPVSVGTPQPVPQAMGDVSDGFDPLGNNGIDISQEYPRFTTGQWDLPEQFGSPGQPNQAVKWAPYKPSQGETDHWKASPTPDGARWLTVSADPGMTGGGSSDFLSGGAGPDRFADTFGPAGGVPGISFGSQDYAGMIEGQPGTQFDMAPLGYTPPRPASLDISPTGSPQDRARQAISDAARAAGVSGAGGSGGNGGGIVPSQSYGGSPGAYSYAGATPWGSSYYTTPSGGYSNSPFTPSGYTPPSFNPISGGPTYAYHPNGQGGGTFVTSDGRTLSY